MQFSDQFQNTQQSKTNGNDISLTTVQKAFGPYSFNAMNQQDPWTAIRKLVVQEMDNQQQQYNP